MIGRSLRERFELGRLDDDRAVRTLERALGAVAKPLVEVRAQGPGMVACLVVEADKRAVRLCRELGFDMRPGGTAVFGLRGPDAASVFPRLSDAQRAWLAEPCRTSETKVLLVAGGIALLSLTTEAGAVAVQAGP